PVPSEEIEGLARNASLTRPRPGHADMAGMQKFGFDEARPLLERASARETATRVALGRVAQQFLAQLGITTASHTVQMGEVALTDGYEFPTEQDGDKLDADPVRCVDREVSARMVETVDATKKTGETP